MYHHQIFFCEYLIGSFELKYVPILTNVNTDLYFMFSGDTYLFNFKGCTGLRKFQFHRLLTAYMKFLKFGEALYALCPSQSLAFISSLNTVLKRRVVPYHLDSSFRQGLFTAGYCDMSRHQ